MPIALHNAVDDDESSEASYRRITPASGRVLQRGLDHDPFESRHCAVEQARLATGQGLIGPLTQRVFPVGHGGSVLLEVEQFGRQIDLV